MSKTPVSILQEFMIKKGCCPQYDLLPSEGLGTHLPTFHYQVTAGTVVAIGKARSKKDAKHEAAKLALDQLNLLGLYHPGPAAAPVSPVFSSNPPSPSKILVNAIGILQDFCTDNNVPQPEFVLLEDVGPAHSRQFTMECKISEMSVIAVDTTKKKAKQLAAQKMLHRLMDTLPDVIASFKGTNDVPAIKSEITVADYEQSSFPKKKTNWGIKITTYATVLRSLMKEKDLTYKTLWQDVEKFDEGDLTNILNKLELHYNLEFISNEDKEIALISINTDPEYLIAEFGTNSEAALSNAVEKMFQFLKIMTIDP